MTTVKPIRGGHINSEELLARQSDSYESQITALKELHESDKKLSLEKQAAIYQRKVAQLETDLAEMMTQYTALGLEKERLERALPSSELLYSDLREKPITERANELADDIDRTTPLSFCRLFHSVNNQIFSGYRQYPSLMDKDVQLQICQITAHLVEFLRYPKEACIILSGAGTSGRIAFQIAQSFNRVLEKVGRPPMFKYCNAGGDPALFMCVETAEDDPAAAVADLKRAEQSSSGEPFHRVFYIGISCGLSATYIGAQLQYAMANPAYTSVFLGFNPTPLARRTFVSGWNTCFADVLAKFKEGGNRRNTILVPVLGPEAIQGSSRLKGGTATKLILETIISMALSQNLQMPLMGGRAVPSTAVFSAGAAPAAEHPAPAEESSGWFGGLFNARSAVSKLGMGESGALERGQAFEAPVQEVLWAYEGVLRAVQEAPLHEVLPLATEALRAGRSIWYVGSGGVATLGMIDASEQVPTFGAREKDVRGFIAGGWEALGKYRAISQLAGGLKGLPALSVEHFVQHVLPSCSTSDLVVVLQSRASGPALPAATVAELAALKYQKAFQLVVVDVLPSASAPAPAPAPAPTAEEPSPAPSASDAEGFAAVEQLAKSANYHLKVTLLRSSSVPMVGGFDAFGEMAIKLCCNTITTGAWVRMGKVYRSRMIDVKVTNVKLFHRAVSIIAELSGVTMDKAKECLMRCVHDVDTNKPLPKRLYDMKPEESVPRASLLTNLVGTSLLIATGKFNLVSARRTLKEDDKAVLRDIIVAAVPSCAPKRPQSASQ